MKLQRGSGTAPGAVLGGCALRAVCRKWRALDSCAGCPRASRGTTPGAAPAAASPRATSAPERRASEAIPDAGPVGLVWCVRHDLPRRTRLRLEAPALRASAEAVEERARSIPGVCAAFFTPETGSLLVEHDGAEATRRALLCALHRLTPEQARARSARAVATPAGPAMGEVVASILTAALPPLPLAAFRLVRSLAASGRER